MALEKKKKINEFMSLTWHAKGVDEPWLAIMFLFSFTAHIVLYQ